SLRAGIFVITHASDFSLVTAQHPATAGEYLAIFATGLGPTNPSVPAGAVTPLALAPLQSSATVVAGGWWCSRPTWGWRQEPLVFTRSTFSWRVHRQGGSAYTFPSAGSVLRQIWCQ